MTHGINAGSKLAPDTVNSLDHDTRWGSDAMDLGQNF